MADDNRSSKKDIDTFAKKAGDKPKTPEWRKTFDDYGWILIPVVIGLLVFAFWGPLNKALDGSGISSFLGLSDTTTDPEIAAKEKELADLKAKKAGKQLPPAAEQTQGGNGEQQGPLGPNTQQAAPPAEERPAIEVGGRVPDRKTLRSYGQNGWRIEKGKIGDPGCAPSPDNPEHLRCPNRWVRVTQ
jgi:hypothetical protein